MKLYGQLYEVTRFMPFVQQYLADNVRPNQECVRPVQDARVGLYRCDLIGSRPLIESYTDRAGRYEIDLSVLPATSVFLVASSSHDAAEGIVGREKKSGCWYRSSPFVPGAITERPLDIYVARQAIPYESGFSQVELAALLAKTKKQVADLEQIAGTITGNGIALTCVGKGARASGKLVLHPDDSSDLIRILRHSIEDFHLELPGPSWLVGLVVSRDAIEASIRTSLRDLAVEIDSRLHLRATALFTEQVQTTDPACGARLADMGTLTLERLRYPAVAHQSGSSSSDRAIAGDVCLGFPRSFPGTGELKTL
jgi:hypothetical protein